MTRRSLLTISDLDRAEVARIRRGGNRFAEVMGRDIKKVRVGDTILIDTEDGGEPIETKISYVSPVGSSDTQSALVRAVVRNSDARLRPGLFVTGRVLLAEKPVPIATGSALVVGSGGFECATHLAGRACDR